VVFHDGRLRRFAAKAGLTPEDEACSAVVCVDRISLCTPHSECRYIWRRWHHHRRASKR
jgi:hypothetical protein